MRRSRKSQRRAWQALYRATWWWVASLLGTVGTAAACVSLGPGGSLVLMTATTILVALGVWQLGPRRGEGSIDARLTVLGMSAGVALLAVVGLTLLVGVPGFGCSVLVAAAGWPLRPRRSLAVAQPDAGRTTADRPAGPLLEHVPADPLPEAETLGALSTPELCRAWQISYTRLCRAALPSYRECLASYRAACLDELERRDPAAFARWLPTARAASDPARIFCPQSQR